MNSQWISLGLALSRPQVKRPAKYGGMQTPSVTYGEYVAKHKPDLFNTPVRVITIAPLYTDNPYRYCYCSSSPRSRCQGAVGLPEVGSGCIVASKVEVPIMLANLV